MSSDRSKASWASSIMDLPNEDATKYGNEGCEDLKEGVGDSDEVLGATIGVSDEFNRMTRGGNLLGIRKKRSEGMKRRKLPPLEIIADALERMVDVYKKEAGRADETSIAKIMNELEKYDEITSTDDWYRRCRSFLMDQNAREMYAALKGQKKQLLIWLSQCLVTEEVVRADEMSITVVIKDLKQYEEITSDVKWFGRCCSLLKNQTARKRYVALKGRKKQLLIWLRHECYKNN